MEVNVKQNNTISHLSVSLLKFLSKVTTHDSTRDKSITPPPLPLTKAITPM